MTLGEEGLEQITLLPGAGGVTLCNVLLGRHKFFLVLFHFSQVRRVLLLLQPCKRSGCPLGRALSWFWRPQSAELLSVVTLLPRVLSPTR